MAYDRCLVITSTAGINKLQRPVDWNPGNNKVEVIGHGGSGYGGAMATDNYYNQYPTSGAGGGGGGYAIAVNVDPPWPVDIWFFYGMTAVFHSDVGYICYVNGGGDAQQDPDFPDWSLSGAGGTGAYPLGYDGGSGGEGQQWMWSTGSGGGGAAGPNGPGRQGNYTYVSYAGYVDIPMMSVGQSGFADDRHVGANPGPPPFEFSTGTPPLPYWTDTNLDWSVLPSPGGFGYTDPTDDATGTSGSYPIIDNVTQILKGQSYGGGGGGGGVNNLWSGYDWYAQVRGGGQGGDSVVILSWEAAAPLPPTSQPKPMVVFLG